MINRIKVQGKIRFLSSFHIGSGESSWKSDALVIKDSIGNPYIPGSTLKGIFRTALERLIPNSCKLIENNTKCITVNKNTQEEFKKLQEQRTSDEELNEFLEKDNNTCPVCKLLGSPFKKSKVFFLDSYATEESIVKTYIKDGIAIDRDTGTTKAKFDYEVVDRNSIFNFTLIAEDLNDEDIELLKIGISEFQSGYLAIGGKTSAGLGFFKLENVKYYKAEFTDAKKIEDYLANGLKEVNNL